jgi:vacuolar protein sorting-associated protein 54
MVHFYILQDKLPAVLRIYRDTLITVMKASIKATVAELLPILVARTIDSDSVTGDRAADSDGVMFSPFITISFPCYFFH